MSVCPTCGQKLPDRGKRDLLTVLAVRANVEYPESSGRPSGTRDVYQSQNPLEWYVTYGGGGPWSDSHVRMLIARGHLVPTHPDSRCSYTLPGNEWKAP